MPVLVPQLSLSSLSQTSHTNQSISGTASDALTAARPADNLPTCNPQSRGAPFLERPSSLCLLSLSLSLCIICLQLCLYHRCWQTIPALRNAFSTGQAIPAQLRGSCRQQRWERCGTSLCLLCRWVSLVTSPCGADARRLSVLARKAPRKLRHHRKIVGSLGLT